MLSTQRGRSRLRDQLGITRTIEIPANRPEIFWGGVRRTNGLRSVIVPVLEEYKAAFRSGNLGGFKKTIIWPRSMVMMDEVMTIIHETLDTDEMRSHCFQTAHVLDYHAASPSFGKQHILSQLLDPDGNVCILIASPALGTGTNIKSHILNITKYVVWLDGFLSVRVHTLTLYSL